MSVLIENKLGTIKLTSSVVVSIVCECLEKSFNKRVWLTDLHGINIMGKDDTNSGVDFYTKDGQFILCVPVIIRFGTSISKLSDELYEELSMEMKKILNVKLDKLILKVRGVKSKQIATRHIDVIRPAADSKSI